MRKSRNPIGGIAGRETLFIIFPKSEIELVDGVRRSFLKIGRIRLTSITHDAPRGVDHRALADAQDRPPCQGTTLSLDGYLSLPAC